MINPTKLLLYFSISILSIIVNQSLYASETSLNNSQSKTKNNVDSFFKLEKYKSNTPVSTLPQYSVEKNIKTNLQSRYEMHDKSVDWLEKHFRNEALKLENHDTGNWQLKCGLIATGRLINYFSQELAIVTHFFYNLPPGIKKTLAIICFICCVSIVICVMFYVITNVTLYIIDLIKKRKNIYDSNIILQKKQSSYESLVWAAWTIATLLTILIYALC